MNVYTQAAVVVSGFLFSLGIINRDKITEKVQKMDDKQKTITAVTVISSFGILASSAMYIFRKSHKQ